MWTVSHTGSAVVHKVHGQQYLDCTYCVEWELEAASYNVGKLVGKGENSMLAIWAFCFTLSHDKHRTK